MAASKRRPTGSTDLTPEQIDTVVAVLSTMRREEADRDTSTISTQEKGRGPVDRVATALGVTQATISAILNGTANPGARVVEALQRAGRIDPARFRGPAPAAAITDPGEPAPSVLSPPQIEEIRRHLRRVEEILASGAGAPPAARAQSR